MLCPAGRQPVGWHRTCFISGQPGPARAATSPRASAGGECCMVPPDACSPPVRDDAGSQLRDARMRMTTNLIRVLLLLLTLDLHRRPGTCAAIHRFPDRHRHRRPRPVVATAPALDAGNTAWMMTSTALVLMMAFPGWPCSMRGMVRKKNVLSVLMQVFATVCVLSLVWMVVGYSLAFTDGTPMSAISAGPCCGAVVSGRRPADCDRWPPWIGDHPRNRLHDVPDDLLR